MSVQSDKAKSNVATVKQGAASDQGAARSDIWQTAPINCTAFVAKVIGQGKDLYRDLPWRNIDDPYAVLVSEVMLQQTQVSRVTDYWQRFLATFPTVDALAAASTSDVLTLWQGLGYNRRALALKRIADECSARWGGTLPQTSQELVQLPGIGPATAAGVMAFAYNQPSCYIETNVRTVFLQEVFPALEKVSDRTLMPFVEAAAACAFEQVSPRVWYYALLDYGAHLKTVQPNPSRRSAHYSRQSTFEGSHRQKRSFVLRCVLANSEGISIAQVRAELATSEKKKGREVDSAEFDQILGELVSEGFFKIEDDLLVP